MDYTFAQVEIDEAGWCTAATAETSRPGVGPFAVDEGMVNVMEGNTTVRIFNTNTNAVIVEEVPVKKTKQCAKVISPGSVAKFRWPREDGLNMSGAGHVRVQVASV